MLRAADLFCGAGGTSAGAKATGGANIVFALDHWERAIQTHSANFPGTVHVNSRLEDTHPSECGKIDLLFASPECTHHSRARGGRPTSDQQRSGAWYVLPWIEHHRPSWIVIENVTEFQEWGPIGNDGTPLKSKRGAFFDSWLMAIRAAGYRVDMQELNAADLGAATSRNRLFVIARKGNKNPVFPEQTHSRNAGGELPGMGLQRWRAAAEVIDWSIPCPSILERKRPLADNTLLRIEAGLRRFVGPFQVVMRNHMGAADVSGPVNTITAGGLNHGLAVPFLADVNHAGQPRVYPPASPLGTVTATNGKAIVTPFVLSTGSGGAPRGTDSPVPTIVTRDGSALVVPWISHYYGNGNNSPLIDPVDTITTKDRHGLAVASAGRMREQCVSHSAAMAKLLATMRELGVCDIGFRMWSNPELALAQGFDKSYIFHGKNHEITRQIGNSVSPPVAEAITRTILSV